MGRKASNLRVPCEQAVAIVGRKTSLLTGRHQAQGGTAIYTDLSVISCVFCIFKLNNKDIYLWWKLGNYWKNNKMGNKTYAAKDLPWVCLSPVVEKLYLPIHRFCLFKRFSSNVFATLYGPWTKACHIFPQIGFKNLLKWQTPVL